MAKQPVAGECFEEVFLEYLRLRFEVEPLSHYVMAAMHVCYGTGRDYPAFVRAFMTWFADSFLFDEKGVFPAQSNNRDPADYRWRRFADCHALLEGWRSKDLKAALKEQKRRWELVEEVAELRSEPRADAMGKDQWARANATKTDAEVFGLLEEWFGEQSHTLKRTYKKLSEPKEFMSFGPIPIETGDVRRVPCAAVALSPVSLSARCLRRADPGRAFNRATAR